MTMSFFGKLKNIHSGPPAPPRRTDDNAGWPQDEFDDEEGDMYEAPPCERPAVKVPQRQVEENVYLERTSSPAVPQRKAPPPRPVKALKPQQRPVDSHYDHNAKKPPEIDRTEKPGRKMLMRPAPAPAPLPVSNTEEDVYLDPNEEQEDNDDLYLEPTAACPPPHREPRRVTPSPMPAFVPPPTHGVKPPVPRAKSEIKLPPFLGSLLPPLNDAKPAPLVEARRATFPGIVYPPPPTSVKPHPPLKPGPPNPPMADTKPVASSVGLRATKQSGNEDKEWFAGDCSRKAAEDLLMRVNKDGAFLIRHSSAQSARQPYTLAVLYQQKVYNVPVRFLEETRGYALGKEGKKNEEIFSTLDEMISHHKSNQLLLIDSKSQAKHTAYLTHPARP